MCITILIEKSYGTCKIKNLATNSSEEINFRPCMCNYWFTSLQLALITLWASKELIWTWIWKKEKGWQLAIVRAAV